jgi:hypothetical protein
MTNEENELVLVVVVEYKLLSNVLIILFISVWRDQCLMCSVPLNVKTIIVYWVFDEFMLRTIF